MSTLAEISSAELTLGRDCSRSRGSLWPDPFGKGDTYFPFVNGLCQLTQALSHNRRYMFLGVSYNKANNTFLNSFRVNDVKD